MSIVFTANTVRPCKVLRGTPFIHVHGLSCNISNMRCSVSSPDETPRRELKYDAQRSIFDELRGVSSGDETLCRMLDITSQTK